jgi:predicted nucleotide-binding protein
MLHRFEGDAARRVRVEALMSQKLVSHNSELAEQMADRLPLKALAKGEVLIEQDGTDNEVFLILAGSFDVIVNGRKVAQRKANDHVGEMAAIEPTQRRAASLVATEESVVAVLSEQDLASLGAQYTEIYLRIARELSRRLLQRNAHITATHDKIRVFIISSAESLEIARTVQNAFARDDFLTVVWTDGVFRVANYTLQSLEDEVNASDFAIAIAHGDDETHSRGQDWPSPRDNVIFELGLFMGRLGRHRAILMEPRGEGIKLPSDLAGVTTIPYRYEKGANAAALMAPACNALRDHIRHWGPNN